MPRSYFGRMAGGLRPVVPADFIPYFSTSASAAAALVGLLFVAVSIAPESSLARSAPTERRAMAVGAFTGLLNAFFISLSALVPHVEFAGPLLGIAISSLISTFISMGLLVRRRGPSSPLRHLFIPLAGFVIYGLEIGVCALPLMQTPTTVTPFIWLAFLLFGVYGVALARAWQLMAGVPAALAARVRAAQEGEKVSSGAPGKGKSLPEA
jgi:hypothetical protein